MKYPQSRPHHASGPNRPQNTSRRPDAPHAQQRAQGEPRFRSDAPPPRGPRSEGPRFRSDAPPPRGPRPEGSPRFRSDAPPPRGPRSEGPSRFRSDAPPPRGPRQFGKGSPQNAHNVERPRAPELLQPPKDDARVAASPFTALGVAAKLVHAVVEANYQTPTPIQTQTIPLVLEGRDLLGCAQTGTGKTAAFMLPLLQRLSNGSRDPERRARALVLSPTRELAAQIGVSTRTYARYTGLRHTVIYGGVSQRAQERELDRTPDVLIATPGRLLDLMRQGLVDLSAVEVLVLDEADTMLDMGFIHDVRTIVGKLPKARQNLLFSATMPPAIRELAKNILSNPASVSVTPQSTTAETVEQAVYFVAKPDKHRLLKQLLGTEGIERALVFTRTKHGADRVARGLVQAGVEAAAIHGNKSQNARERALEGFRRGTTTVLVATDIAARGIDVQGVSHVINYDLPNVAESYVHRIGRTGRAGATGRAISFCDKEERKLLMDIERLIRRRIRIATVDAPNPASVEAPSPAE